MNQNIDEIYELIVKSLGNELTDEETIRLNEWKSQHTDNVLEYNNIKDIWECSGKMAFSTSIHIQQSLHATHHKAGMDKKPSITLGNKTIVFQIAAMITLAVIFSSLYNIYATKQAIQQQTTVFQTIKSAFGIQSRIELPDGTIVKLNSGSSITFPTTFIGMDRRNVKLSGEAHFVVSKNEKQPFIVELDKMQVKVLGTTFNVEAYKNNSVITIALVEGKITLQQKTDNHVTDLIEMNPHQVACYNQKTNQLLRKTEDDLSKYTAWTEGKIVFSDDAVHTVMEKLENWYNVDIRIVDKKLEAYRFTGTFCDEPLEQVLNLLNLTSKMKHTIIPTTKLNDNHYSQRIIILESK
jgi:ferric-dicitrate binding protein FerR (iron transport regulator)